MSVHGLNSLTVHMTNAKWYFKHWHFTWTAVCATVSETEQKHLVSILCFVVSDLAYEILWTQVPLDRTATHIPVLTEACLSGCFCTPSLWFHWSLLPFQSVGKPTVSDSVSSRVHSRIMVSMPAAAAVRTAVSAPVAWRHSLSGWVRDQELPRPLNGNI